MITSPSTPTSKSLDTVVQDIYGVFDKDVTVSPEVAKAFGEGLAQTVIDKIKPDKKNYLRLSNLGTACKRKLWYSINTPELGEKLSGPARIKFLIGDITEAVILFLAKLAGHNITDEQKEVNLHGVRGHIDALGNGEPVDVKSASPFSFRKFQEGIKPETDAFGYLSQLGSYCAALASKRGHFLAVDKVLGTLHLDTHEFPETDYEAKINEARSILASNEPPERGFSDEVDGGSGNRKLGLACSYCDFKHTCWPGLSVYQYARGPVFLTQVRREPRVPQSPS